MFMYSGLLNDNADDTEYPGEHCHLEVGLSKSERQVFASIGN